VDLISANADAGNDVRSVFLFLLLPVLLAADGGTVLFHNVAGDFDITVFSKSEAVQAGVNDLSVMVQGSDHNTIMNATVLLRLERTQPTGEIMRLTGIATHKKATNKMLYATSVNIPSTGEWQVQAVVTADGKHGMIASKINVLPPAPPVQNYWPLVAMVPLLGIAFIINRKLRAKFRARVP
jgi:hypothetical protein